MSSDLISAGQATERLATSWPITMSMMIAAMGLRSIIPVFGITRRNGSMIGSVTRNSIW